MSATAPVQPPTARTFDISTGRTSGAGKYKLQKMKDRHKRIAERVAAGQKDTEIARDLGVTPQMVAYTRESPIVQGYLQAVSGAMEKRALDIGGEIRALAPYALATIEDVMLNPHNDPKVRLNAAQDLMDRAGHGAVKKVAVGHGQLTEDDINDIKARARGSNMISGSNGDDPPDAQA